jgi:hypothetical protein
LLQAALQKRTLGAGPILVPGIELVRVAPPRSILRCFRAEECRTEAPQIVGLLNGLVDKPQIVLDDQSARWENSTAIRARHYELWLVNDVVMAAPT